MATPIYNPVMPYLGPLFGGLSPGKMIVIQGNSYPTAQRFSINLQCGPNIHPHDDIALHVDVRFVNSTVVRNSFIMQQWGPEEVFGPFPFIPGQGFEIMILVEASAFKIAINGLHYAEYMHRTPVNRVSYLKIEGDTTISCIRFEGASTSFVPVPGSAPYSAPYQGGAPMQPYPVGQIPPPGQGLYPRQPGVPYSPAPAVAGHLYTTYPHSPHRSPRHSPHLSRSAAIPIVGGAAAGLLTGAMLHGHHHKAMKKQKKWMKKAFKHKAFKHKHKHGFHFHHGFHRHSSSSSSSEEE